VPRSAATGALAHKPVDTDVEPAFTTHSDRDDDDEEEEEEEEEDGRRLLTRRELASD